MDLEPLKEASSSLISEFNEENCIKFTNEIEKIPEMYAFSADSSVTKLNKLKETNCFSAFKVIFKASHNKEIKISEMCQLKILKFWDFLLQSTNSKEEINYLFSDNKINDLIMYKCSLSDEILQMYSTVLKGISMKAKDLDDFSVLFSDGTCPLFIYANPHIYNADSVVLSGARMVILNLCLIKNPIIQDLICGAKSGIRTLISSLDTDEFLFLADLMNVVPLSLLNYIIKHLRAELSSTNLHTLAKAISYLEQSPARSMLMELVSSKLPIMLEIKSDLPMALSLTLFCLKNKLILLDPAIEFGMIDSYGNSSRKPKSKKGFNFKETVIQIFTKQISVETVALTLKIIEFLYGSEIPDVYIVNNTIIGELKKMSPNVLLPIFLKQIKPQRCDMTYYISQKADLPKYSNEQKKIFILYEIQKYLTQGNFQGFILDSSTCTEKQGPVKDINNRIIVLNEGELIFSDEKYKISDFYVCDKKETSKTSNKVFFKSKSNSFNENFFEFPSTEIAKLFKQNLENMQRIVISNMLDKLVMKPERY